MDPAECDSSRKSCQIWVDVGDLLQWKDSVTGIQRVMASVVAELLRAKQADGPFRFCQLVSGVGFLEVPREKIGRHVQNLLGEELNTPDPQIANTFVGRALAQGRRGFAAALRWVYGPISRALEPRSGDTIGWVVRLRRRGRNLEFWLLRTALGPNEFFQSNDLLLNVGSSWWQADYTQTLIAVRRNIDLRYVVLVYDLIPWRLPRYFPKQMTRQFVAWGKASVPLAYKLMTISDCSRRDLVAFARKFNLPKKPIKVIKLGRRQAGKADFELPVALQNSPAGFVLAVARVEPRKNHIILIRTWAELLKNHNPDLVPQLVWVGRKGWMVDDLMDELTRSRWLDGKLSWLGKKQGISEEMLDVLYPACLFTMFPSFYEGWGLPVSESLAYGKFCIASNSSSIPEAGGDLVDYHGPEDIDECVRLTERAILDPAYRAAREERIRREFRMPSWAECAKSIIEACQDEPRGGGSGRS